MRRRPTMRPAGLRVSAAIVAAVMAVLFALALAADYRAGDYPETPTTPETTVTSTTTGGGAWAP